MANSILSAVLPSSAFRVYNERNNTQVWKSLAVSRVQIDVASANAKNPLSNVQRSQTGTYQLLMKQDVEASKIIRPTRMLITGFIPDISTVENVIASWLSRQTTFTIMSRGVIGDNMAVINVEFEQSPEMLSAQKVTIEVEQAAVATFNKFDPAQPADQSTYGIRIQTPSSVLGTVASVYNRVTSFVGSFA